MNLTILKELLATITFQFTKNLVRPQTKNNVKSILFLNQPWGNSLNFVDLDLPPNFELTTNKSRYREAAAVVFHIPTLNWLYHVKKQPGQIWIAWSMECVENYPQLRNPEFMQHFDLTMTYQLNSDVPASYFKYHKNSDLRLLLKTEPQKKVSGNIASLFISSCFDKSDRLTYARELMRYMDVHSFGKQLNNHTLKNDNGRQTKWDLIAGYKFTFSFENAIATDYVTEKFYDPLIVGSVPVYMGAPNVELYSPGDKCFINVTDFGSPKEIADYLLKLHEDEALYQEYLAWKKKPLRSSFLQLLEEQREPAFVRLCQKVQALKTSDNQKSELLERKTNG